MYIDLWPGHVMLPFSRASRYHIAPGSAQLTQQFLPKLSSNWKVSRFLRGMTHGCFTRSVVPTAFDLFHMKERSQIYDEEHLSFHETHDRWSCWLDHSPDTSSCRVNKENIDPKTKPPLWHSSVRRIFHLSWHTGEFCHNRRSCKSIVRNTESIGTSIQCILDRAKHTTN